MSFQSITCALASPLRCSPCTDAPRRWSSAMTVHSAWVLLSHCTPCHSSACLHFSVLSAPTLPSHLLCLLMNLGNLSCVAWASALLMCLFVGFADLPVPSVSFLDCYCRQRSQWAENCFWKKGREGSPRPHASLKAGEYSNPQKKCCIYQCHPTEILLWCLLGLT